MNNVCKKCGGTRFRTKQVGKRYKCRTCGTDHKTNGQLFKKPVSKKAKTPVPEASV